MQPLSGSSMLFGPPANWMLSDVNRCGGGMWPLCGSPAIARFISSTICQPGRRSGSATLPARHCRARIRWNATSLPSPAEMLRG